MKRAALNEVCLDYANDRKTAFHSFTSHSLTSHSLTSHSRTSHSCTSHPFLLFCVDHATDKKMTLPIPSSSVDVSTSPSSSSAFSSWSLWGRGKRRGRGRGREPAGGRGRGRGRGRGGMIPAPGADGLEESHGVKSGRTSGSRKYKKYQRRGEISDIPCYGCHTTYR